MMLSLLPVSVIDRFIEGKLSDIESFHRFLKKTDPELLEELSWKKTRYVFNKTYKSIVPYKDLVGRTAIIREQDFRQLPILTKENYILKAAHFRDLCVKKADTIYESSGYSGSPTPWPVSTAEEELGKKYVNFILNVLFETKKKASLIINTFALGSWVTGMEVSKITGITCTVINTGPSEDEIWHSIERFRDDFDQIILFGYPPFIKNLLEEHDVKGIDIKVILGAELFSEELRDYIYDLLGKGIDDRSIFAGYGASDIGITGANETLDSVRIRRLANKNPELRKELFGESDILPMLFQYDPLKLRIEEVDGELVFTTLDLSRAMPLIRYNLKDIGGTIRFKKMQEVLAKHEISSDIELPLPFLFVEGRSEGVLNFFGSLVSPEVFEEILYSDKNLAKKFSGKFHIAKINDKKLNPWLKVEIQLQKGIKKTRRLLDSFSDKINQELIEKLPDLRAKKQYFEQKYKGKICHVDIFEFSNFKDEGAIKNHYMQ